METEPETEGISLEDTLESLKRNAHATDVYLQESIKRMKLLQKHLAEETEQTPSQMPLQPKTRMMKWLTDRGLAVESSFQEFFEAFIEEHKKEHRLDLSRRSIQLNTAASVLFGYKDTNPWISLYELLGKVSSLYH